MIPLRTFQVQTSLQDIPRRVYIRYGLLSIPGTAAVILILLIIQRWVAIPIWLWATLIFLWIAKDMILFPFVWRSYDQVPTEVAHAMVGARGITRDRLAPDGYILIRGELWKSEKTADSPPIDKNQPVRVIDIDGLKLFVARDDAGSH
jgi:membrane-bound ClpP family serine protease